MSEQNLEGSLRPETPVTPESGTEVPIVTRSEQVVLPVENNAQPAPTVSTAGDRLLSNNKDPQLIEIESILSDGLDQAYMSMTAEKRLEFRRKGEQVAVAIQAMVHKGKTNLRKIRNLIISWLKVIPGVNKYFLEQEAKIKADKIADMHK